MRDFSSPACTECITPRRIENWKIYHIKSHYFIFNWILSFLLFLMQHEIRQTDSVAVANFHVHSLTRMSYGAASLGFGFSKSHKNLIQYLRIGEDGKRKKPKSLACNIDANYTTLTDMIFGECKEEIAVKESTEENSSIERHALVGFAGGFGSTKSRRGQWHWLQSWKMRVHSAHSPPSPPPPPPPTNAKTTTQTKINDFANEHTNCCSRFRICQCNGFASAMYYIALHECYGPKLMASSPGESLGDSRIEKRESKFKVILHKITNLTEKERDFWNARSTFAEMETVNLMRTWRHHERITESPFSVSHIARADRILIIVQETGNCFDSHLVRDSDNNECNENKKRSLPFWITLIPVNCCAFENYRKNSVNHAKAIQGLSMANAIFIRIMERHFN